MIERITTPNMLEIAYLLDRRHQIIGVSTAITWPYGINDLAVTLEGDNIDLDHGTFLRHGIVSFAHIAKAMDAVQRVIARQQDAQA